MTPSGLLLTVSRASLSKSKVMASADTGHIYEHKKRQQTFETSKKKKLYIYITLIGKSFAIMLVMETVFTHFRLETP